MEFFQTVQGAANNIRVLTPVIFAPGNK